MIWSTKEICASKIHIKDLESYDIFLTKLVKMLGYIKSWLYKDRPRAVAGIKESPLASTAYSKFCLSKKEPGILMSEKCWSITQIRMYVEIRMGSLFGKTYKIGEK